jgi:two-component system, sensor histidine kinase PdtaS
VRSGKRLLGVITRNTNLLGIRTPSRLELAYLQTAGDLARMISDGSFPHVAERPDMSASPRVGDGFLRLDEAGLVSYASPNAQSAYRRLGLPSDLLGRNLGDVTVAVLSGASGPGFGEPLAAVVSGHGHCEAEIDNGDATVILRAIPLRPDGEHIGALVLLRDVTELRRRERELLSKDATIREIHHRVKNNLQTVAALLRLQARRIQVPEGRVALVEAVRRVGSIAIVHETLSQALDERVDFDQIADRLRQMVTDVSSTDAAIKTSRTGSFGALPAEVATPLAMVLTELMQNAVEHGLRDRSGSLIVGVDRIAGRLRVVVDDDGAGVPQDFDPELSAGLGLSIVLTLVESELSGILDVRAGPEGGTRVVVDIPMATAPGLSQRAGT